MRDVADFRHALACRSLDLSCGSRASARERRSAPVRSGAAARLLAATPPLREPAGRSRVLSGISRLPRETGRRDNLQGGRARKRPRAVLDNPGILALLSRQSASRMRAPLAFGADLPTSLTCARRSGSLSLHRENGGAGFGDLSVARRSKSRAILCGFFYVRAQWETARSAGALQAGSPTRCLPGHPFGEGSSGFIRTARRAA